VTEKRAEKKREKGVKSDGKKDGQNAFIRSRQASFKCDGKIDGKRAEKGREGEKVAERKMTNMHLLEACKLGLNVA
jgi:hypothetical protein